MATESETPISELTADEAYLEFIASGDQEAFGQMYRLLHGPATGHAKRVATKSAGLKDIDALVEDSVLDAFNTINLQFRKLKRGIWNPDGGGRFKSWFLKIVENEVRNRTRLKYGDHKTLRPGIGKEESVKVESVDMEGNSLVEQHADKDSPTPLQAAILTEEARARVEKAEALKDCVDKLDEESKGVILMTFYEGQNLRQIAEHFGWVNEQKRRPQTEKVDRLLKRARPQLAECMGRKGHE